MNVPQPSVEFTAIIPAFNPGSMLHDALESVASQTLAATWVVVIDDGSTDGTFDAATRWLAELGLPGQVLRQANQGISAARNAGLAARRSATVALLDADDVWLPHHLANLDRAYALCPDAIVTFGDARYFGDPRSRTDLLSESVALQLSEAVLGEKVHRLSSAVFDRTLPGQFFSPSASSFRMDRGRSEPRFATDLPVGEDRYLFLQLASMGPFVYVNEWSLRHRRHQGNTTHSDKAIWLREQALRLLEKIRTSPEFTLTAEQRRIVDDAQRDNAKALLFAASREGLGVYRKARHTVAAYLAPAGSVREYGRALVASVKRGRLEPPFSG